MPVSEKWLKLDFFYRLRRHLRLVIFFFPFITFNWNDAKLFMTNNPINEIAKLVLITNRNGLNNLKALWLTPTLSNIAIYSVVLSWWAIKIRKLLKKISNTKLSKRKIIQFYDCFGFVQLERTKLLGYRPSHNDRELISIKELFLFHCLPLALPLPTRKYKRVLLAIDWNQICFIALAFSTSSTFHENVIVIWYWKRFCRREEQEILMRFMKNVIADFFLCFSHTRPAKINRFFLFLQLITEKLTVVLIRRRKVTRWLYRVSIIIIIVKIPQFMNFFTIIYMIIELRLEASEKTSWNIVAVNPE